MLTGGSRAAERAPGTADATEGDRPTVDALFDTSAAVALVLADHESHRAVADATRGWRRGLAGHAWFETYSVLTRLPSGQRRSPDDVLQVLSTAFPGTRFLDAAETSDLRGELARLRISGGAVYDALVGAVARRVGADLVTCDRRAQGTYDALGVHVRLIDGRAG